MSSSQSDLLQTSALRSNVSSLRSRKSSTDNTSKPCIITMLNKSGNVPHRVSVL